MRRIKQDVTDVLSLEEKTKLLKEINKEGLLDLFKNSKNTQFKPVEAKKVSLDQQVSLSLSQTEKDYIGRELQSIRQIGRGISVSSFVRNRSITPIDIEEWAERATEGLNLLTSPEYNEQHLVKKKKQFMKLLEEVEEDDKEQEFYYNKQLQEINNRLEEIKKIPPQRRFRLSGRVTFNEANSIKWRAARLSLTVADYLRFVIFGYTPFSDADKHMSLDSRKRFYISILDVRKNGWGEPPQVNECPNCARLQHDIGILREQLARYKSIAN